MNDNHNTRPDFIIYLHFVCVDARTQHSHQYTHLWEPFVDLIMTSTEDMIIYSQVTYAYEIKITSKISNWSNKKPSSAAAALLLDSVLCDESKKKSDETFKEKTTTTRKKWIIISHVVTKILNCNRFEARLTFKLC